MRAARVRTALGAASGRSLFVRAVVAAMVACGGPKAGTPAEAPPGVSLQAPRPAVDFVFDSLDARPVNAASMRGKPCVIAFVTTGSLPAQAQVDYLVAMAKNDGDRVNYAVVALDNGESRELVELYAKALSIPFPVAMADALTRSGAGVFGDVSAVPVTVVLDRAGRVVWRVDARVAKSAEIRGAMR
jgi:hypothetical protein